jgi:hypothetical protein
MHFLHRVDEITARTGNLVRSPFLFMAVGELKYPG